MNLRLNNPFFSFRNIIYSYNSLHDSSSLVIPSLQMNDFTSVIARLLEENLKPLEEKILSLETTNSKWDLSLVIFLPWELF